MVLVQIKKLSKVQKNNLLKGKGVRIKLGYDETIQLNNEQYKKFVRNSNNGKAYTLKLDAQQLAKRGAGLFGDIYGYIKRTPALREASNALIRGGKKYAHRGINYLSNKAHSKIEQIPTIQGEGILGDVIGFVNPTAGTIARTLGLGMKKRRGAGIMDVAAQLAKNAVKGLAKKGVETGANYLTNKIEGMGMTKRKRKISEKQLANLAAGRAKRQMNIMNNKKIGSGRSRKKISGAALYPAGY